MTPAIQLLATQKIPHSVHRYSHDSASSAYGKEAARSLGIAPQRVFKTLLVATPAQPVKQFVGLVPVCHQLDLKAMAKVAGVKTLELADPAVAERLTGYIVGGISPLGQKKRLPTIIDQTAQQHDTIFISAGRRGLEIALAASDLGGLLNAQFAPIAR